MEEKQRIIQEYVPGKQVTLAHIIPSPVPSLYMKLGLVDAEGAIGIFTITPTEAAMIAADVASKAADVDLGLVDRFNGSLVITGDVAAVGRLPCRKCCMCFVSRWASLLLPS